MEIDKKSQPGDPSYFACSCKEEGKKTCEDLLKKVKELLSSDDSNFLTNVVYSLNIKYNSHITRIAADQWCGIYTETYDTENDKPVFTTDIDCDEVEVGIAATWYAYYKKFGVDRRGRKLTPELISKSIRTEDGEYAWKREDIEQVLSALNIGGGVVRKGNVWAVISIDKEITNQDKATALSDGRIVMTDIPDKSKSNLSFSWEYKQETPMNHAEICEDSGKYALKMINNMNLENIVAPEFVSTLYYNLTWH